MVKVLILGNSGVGKSNILTRYCEGIFNQHHLSTIGMNLLNVKVLRNWF